MPWPARLMNLSASTLILLLPNIIINSLCSSSHLWQRKVIDLYFYKVRFDQC